MTKPLFLGIDTGTQSTKALLVDVLGEGEAATRVLARAKAPHTLIEGLGPGVMEQPPAMWWDAVCAVTRELAAHPLALRRGIGGIGVSGQQHGFVPLDARGAVIRPAKLWCDTSTAAEADDLSQRLGRRIPAGFTASKILWLLRHEPENAARLAHVLLPHDYVNWKLTGRMWMECGDASGTGFFDVRARRFDAASCAAIHERLMGLLPELLPAEAVGGWLTRAAALATGLPEGTPVSVGGGDNMLSAIGAGAAADGPVVASLGTSATVMSRASAAVIDPAGLVAPFCDSTGAWLPLLCVMNAAGALDQMAATLGASTEQCCGEAATAPRGAGGILCLPFFSGERVPDLPRATARFDGLRPDNATRPLIFRAVLEGITCNLSLGIRRLQALGVPVNELRLVGGGARFPLWRQLLADATGVPVVRPVEAESAALGAAVQAAFAAGGGKTPIAELARRCIALHAVVDEPDAGAAPFWDEQRARFTVSVREHFGVDAAS